MSKDLVDSARFNHAVNSTRRIPLESAENYGYKIRRQKGKKWCEQLIKGINKSDADLEQYHKNEQEKIKQKKAKSLRDQNNLELNLKRYAPHLDNQKTKKLLDGVASQTPIKELKRLRKAIVNKELNLRINEIERNSLYTWLSNHIEEKG